jgi:hypothetical protein
VRTYLVFEPAAGGRSLEAADRILFVREKFSWTALIFAPLWLLWHRLWLGLLGWLVAVIIIGLVAWVLMLDQTTASIAGFIPSLVVALEGTELRRMKLQRRGYRYAGVVVAQDLEDAERRFFTRWIVPAKAAMPPAPRASLPPLAETPVIGLFPQSGAIR